MSVLLIAGIFIYCGFPFVFLNQGRGGIPKRSILGCILQHWKAFKSNFLTQTQLIEYCILWWPDYLLDNQEKGPVHGVLHQNGILELMLYCQKKEKWNDIPYTVPRAEMRQAKINTEKDIGEQKLLEIT